jgi:DNA-binding transcriptional ArsR family regulator
MNSTAIQQFVARLAALSQPTRLKIVEVVARGGEEGVAAGDIARAVHCPASTLSFHLKELSQAGLLSAAPQGRFIRYSVVPAAFSALAHFVGTLPGLEQPAPAAAEQPVAGRKKKGIARGKQERAAPGTEGQLSIFGE